MTFYQRIPGERRLNIAVVGSGISGLSAAWLLSHRHEVTVYEAADRIGGHSNTVEFESASGPVVVDTGFIVYNELTYPNLTALFHMLQVPTTASNMSFAVSMDNGAFEYSGGTGLGLLAQPINAVSLRFWSMMRDLLRFYRNAPRDLATMDGISLEQYLDLNGYGRAFRYDHLYPMASAIWSTPTMDVAAYPAAGFVKFSCNHGLLRLWNRPTWRTVEGGSREYVSRMSQRFSDKIRISTPVTVIRREEGRVIVHDGSGQQQAFDDVVVATHADQALRMLADASDEERRVLGAFRYSRNEAVLHGDTGLMPKRRAAWSSWNYVVDRRTDGCDEAQKPSITYWMNKLQPLGTAPPTFVTLNPQREPRPDSILRREVCDHPVFALETEQAQQELWSLQGKRNTWFCGAHFGAGFHEDGLQAGLAVAEELGGLRRPWQVAQESARIVRKPLTRPAERPVELEVLA